MKLLNVRKIKELKGLREYLAPKMNSPIFKVRLDGTLSLPSHGRRTFRDVMEELIANIDAYLEDDEATKYEKR